MGAIVIVIIFVRLINVLSILITLIILIVTVAFGWSVATCNRRRQMALPARDCSLV